MLCNNVNEAIATTKEFIRITRRGLKPHQVLTCVTEWLDFKQRIKYKFHVTSDPKLWAAGVDMDVNVGVDAKVTAVAEVGTATG